MSSVPVDLTFARLSVLCTKYPFGSSYFFHPVFNIIIVEFKIMLSQTYYVCIHVMHIHVKAPYRDFPLYMWLNMYLTETNCCYSPFV